MKCKGLAFLLAVLLTVQLICIPALAQADRTIFLCDFETKTFGTNAVASYTDSGEEEHGKVLDLKSVNDSSAYIYSHYTRLTTKFDETIINKNKVLLSYDFKIVSSGGDFMFLIRNQTDSEIASFNVTGKGLFSGYGGGQTSSAKAEEGTWHHVEILCDFAGSNIYVGFDGKALGSIRGNASNTEYLDNMYIGTIQRADGEYWIDNVRLEDFTGRDNAEFTETLDDGKGDFVISCKTPQLGSIFFDKNVTFSVLMKNKPAKDMDAEYRVRVYNSETGNMYFDKTESATLEGAAVTEKEYSVTVDRYGYYDIVVDVTDAEGNVKSGTGKFTVVHAPADGVQNPEMAICDHIITKKSGLDEYERKIELIAKAGISGYREEIPWYAYEKPKGVYALSESWKNVHKEFKKHNIEHMVLLAGAGPYGDGGRPRTAEHAEAAGNYAGRLAEEIKGTVPHNFEIYNEWNITSNNGGATAADYVAVQKEMYKKVKAADPDAYIYGLGGATVVANMEQWIDEVFALGGGDYADGFSIHPYEFIQKPEGSKSFEYIQSTRDLMQKYNLQDKGLASSEFGWPSLNVGDDNQAKFSVRYMVMATGLLDKIYWYNFQCKEDTSASENSFGWIRPWDEGMAEPYEAYSAKPVYLAMANYNALMTGAEKVGQIDSDEDVYAYRFKSTDGGDSVVVWNTSGEKQSVSFKTDAEKVTVYDMYGNDSTLYAHNGAVNLIISDAPTYVMGSFGTFEKAEPIFTAESYSITVPAGDYTSVTVNKSAAEDFDIAPMLPENITVAENSGFNGANAAVKLYTGTQPHKNAAESGGTVNTTAADNGDETVYLRINEKGTDRTIAILPMAVNYTDSVLQTVSVQPFRNGRKQMKIVLQNIKSTGAVSGKITLKSPEEIVRNDKEYTFTNLLPHNTRTILLNIPEKYPYQHAEMSTVLELDSGEVIDYSDNLYFSSIMPVPKTPSIDGTISAGEWNTTAAMKVAYADQAEYLQGWRGTSDLSGKVYLGYDADNFYLAAEVTDDIEYDVDELNRIYVCDSIQFAFTNVRKAGATRTEYGLGLLNGKPQIARYSFISADTEIVGVKDNQSYDDIEYMVRRNGNKTVYECKIPWTQIYGKEINVADYDSMFFSFLINENDGKGRAGWMEYGSGIGYAKQPELFIKIPVQKG